ncbi:putative amidohydrolase YtcJ [Bradysia coprophila]|uniref:putative amidohydrolase YtcJ n=1 Tax=Bradysia coprophila TaxID=38358 RepID=UPI00187DCE0C|nr:putative amidohydrolase YtcJ [Bradysia coprophila]
MDSNDDEVILFENGSIWQWTDHGSEAKRANWFTVHNNKFKNIGNGDAPHNVRKTATKTINLGGRLVLPGLHDSHIHIYHMGECMQYVDLHGCHSIDELKKRVAEHAIDHPDSKWILGVGWEQDKLTVNGAYPSRYDLDEVVSDRPIFLSRACWHIAVCNTKAMEIAGMNLERNDLDISNGVVDVDENGVPTGVLREDARNLVMDHIQESSDAVRLKYLSAGLRQCLQFGLTAVHTNDFNCWKLYQQLQLQANLPIRVYLTPKHCEIGGTDIPPSGTTEDLLSCDRVKLFSDGSLGAETAALRLPYRGTDNRGVLMESDENLLRKILEAEANGYRVEIHAIGDRAAAQVINAIKMAGIKPERRPILTHCQVLGPDLIESMKQLGIIADIQPSFVVTDTSFARKRLDEGVLPYSYCWKRLMNSNIVCAGGSDAPIETSNPFQGIYDAMFRCEPGAEDCLHIEERLSFEQALLMYTKNGVFTVMKENELGEIRSGFKADFVVLHDDVTKDYERLRNDGLVHSVWVDGIERFNANKDNGTDGVDSGLQFRNSNLGGKNGRMGFCPCCSR